MFNPKRVRTSRKKEAVVEQKTAPPFRWNWNERLDSRLQKHFMETYSGGQWLVVDTVNLRVMEGAKSENTWLREKTLNLGALTVLAFHPTQR